MSDDSVKKAIDEIIVSTAKGRHTMYDYINCIIPDKNIETVAHNIQFNFKIICEEEGIRVVGEKCIIFDGSISPPGFTFCCLLDESHITFHSYASTGEAAIDLFTCCKMPHGHFNALRRIEDLMTLNFPDGKLFKRHSVARFLTPYESPAPYIELFSTYPQPSPGLGSELKIENQ